MEIVSILFIALTLASFAWLTRIIFNSLEKTGWALSQKRNFKIGFLLSLLIWAVFVTVWSLSGKMSDFHSFPFNMAPVLAVPMIAILFFVGWKGTQPVVANLSQYDLVALQSFRFFVELLLWRLFVLNELPIQMSFEGRNWDVLTGITAVFIAYFIKRRSISRTVLIIWNLFGLGLLINIVSIAILSMPSPSRFFMNEPANTIVTHFPVSFLPAFLVPLAYGLHFLSLRKLVKEGKVY
jgi:hypothetical protein